MIQQSVLVTNSKGRIAKCPNKKPNKTDSNNQQTLPLICEKNHFIIFILTTPYFSIIPKSAAIIKHHPNKTNST